MSLTTTQSKPWTRGCAAPGPWYVYVITDPSGVRYVGIAKNPYKRMLEHAADGCSSSDSRVGRWLTAAIRAGRPWGMVVKSVHGTSREALAEESLTTRALAELGFRLLNITYRGSRRASAIHRKGFVRRFGWKWR